MCLARLNPIIWAEAERAGWSQEDVASYLQLTFQKSKILQLTDAEARDLIQHLKTKPSVSD